MKQLNKLLKAEYEATLEDYEKTANSIRLDNTIVKSIIYNTIMGVLLFAYASNLNNIIMDKCD